jgi:hypothetical protein
MAKAAKYCSTPSATRNQPQVFRFPKTYFASLTKKFALSIAAIPYSTFRVAAITSMTPAKVTSP